MGKQQIDSGGREIYSVDLTVCMLQTRYTVIDYLPLRGKFRGSINEHECSYFCIYSDKTQIISLPMRIEHSNPNSKSQSEISLVLTGLLYQSKCS